MDEFTGRLMYGRRYNEGLHQAIEAKEGVTVAGESKTLATLSLIHISLHGRGGGKPLCQQGRVQAAKGEIEAFFADRQ